MDAVETVVEAGPGGLDSGVTEEVVAAAIDTTVDSSGGSECTAVQTGGEVVTAATSAVLTAHAPELQAVVAAAARDSGLAGTVQRRVVVLGNTAHLVTIHPGRTAAQPVGADTQSGADTTADTANTENNNTSQEAVSTDATTEPTMIDTSDFRMSEPTYQTLTSVNGRMTPPAYHLQGHYATLTPLQPVTPGPLPPISSIQMGEKFGYSPIVTSPNVSGSFTVMQNNSLAQISLAAPPYSYDTKLVSMGMSPPHYTQNNGGLHGAMAGHQHSPGTLSPQPYQQNGGLHSPHKPMSPNPYDYTSSRAGMEPQSPHDLSPNSSNLETEHSPGTSDAAPAGSYSQSVYTSTPLTSTNNPSLNGMASVSPHTISPGPHPSPSLPAHTNSHHRELSPPSPQSIPHPSPILPPTTILHHPNISHHNMNSSLKSPNSSTSSNGEIEEINTKELAQRISAELKRYSIPQAIFAQRVLCRSQGTLSDLLRNPKPWSKLKSGRETFRRMFKWLQEPEFQRMSSLRLAGRNTFLFLVKTSTNPT